MKPWPPRREEPALQPLKVMHMPLPVPEPAKPAEPAFALDCVACGATARMLFEGSSYCRECLKFKMRTGQNRRFYSDA